MSAHHLGGAVPLAKGLLYASKECTAERRKETNRVMVRRGEAGPAGVRILLQWCNILLTMMNLEVNLRRTAEQIYSGQHWTDAPILWATAPASQLPAAPLVE